MCCRLVVCWFVCQVSELSWWLVWLLEMLFRCELSVNYSSLNLSITAASHHSYPHNTINNQQSSIHLSQTRLHQPSSLPCHSLHSSSHSFVHPLLVSFV